MGFMQPDEFFPLIDVLVQPSLLHETFGRTIIEAYAYGKPVLVSNRGGSFEIVDEKETGLIFDPTDSNTLSSGLLWYINNWQKIAEMSEKTLLKSKEFLPSQIAEKTILTYSQVLGNHETH